MSAPCVLPESSVRLNNFCRFFRGGRRPCALRSAPGIRRNVAATRYNNGWRPRTLLRTIPFRAPYPAVSFCPRLGVTKCQQNPARKGWIKRSPIVSLQAIHRPPFPIPFHPGPATKRVREIPGARRSDWRAIRIKQGLRFDPVAAGCVDVMEHYGRALRLEELVNRAPGSIESAIVGDRNRAVAHNFRVQVLQGQNG